MQQPAVAGEGAAAPVVGLHDLLRGRRGHPSSAGLSPSRVDEQVGWTPRPRTRRAAGSAGSTARSTNARRRATADRRTPSSPEQPRAGPRCRRPRRRPPAARRRRSPSAERRQHPLAASPRSPSVRPLDFHGVPQHSAGDARRAPRTGTPARSHSARNASACTPGPPRRAEHRGDAGREVDGHRAVGRRGPAPARRRRAAPATRRHASSPSTAPAGRGRGRGGGRDRARPRSARPPPPASSASQCPRRRPAPLLDPAGAARARSRRTRSPVSMSTGQAVWHMPSTAQVSTRRTGTRPPARRAARRRRRRGARAISRRSTIRRRGVVVRSLLGQTGSQ